VTVMPRDSERPGPADLRLRALLAAASAPAHERELAGEEAAVAAFHGRLAEAGASHGAVPHRRKLRIALASLAVAVIAAAAATLGTGWAGRRVPQPPGGATGSRTATVSSVPSPRAKTNGTSAAPRPPSGRRAGAQTGGGATPTSIPALNGGPQSHPPAPTSTATSRGDRGQRGTQDHHHEPGGGDTNRRGKDHGGD
jgi:hypothetical protein